MPPLPGTFGPVWRLLRPRQWTKNAIVLAALLFGRQAGDARQVARALLAFAAFCAASSAGYVFNDVLDAAADRRDPRTRARPVAAGVVHRQVALLLAPALGAVALLFVAGALPGTGACVAGYLVLAVAYSTVLKRVAMVDVMAIAAGFVLRAAAGALAIAVPISPWLLMCTALLALLLGLAKRRQALHAAGGARRVPAGYTPALVDQMIGIVTSCTLMAYILYTFADRTTALFPSRLMPVTSAFVLFGIFRYLHLVYARDEGGEPEAVLLADRPTQVNLALYILAVFLAVRP